jgi:hypothetical protein
VIRGIHVLVVAAVLLAAVAVRATEVYTSRYQTLPVFDWVESRPPLAESPSVPAADELARGLQRVLPLLVIRDDARTFLPGFGPPPGLQRTISGVRDASTIQLGSPGTYAGDAVPITARLNVIVFNRAERAAAWTALWGHAMDVRDPQTGVFQVRLAGPDDPDMVWVPLPSTMRGGMATIAGYRGTIGFVLQVNLLQDSTADSARLADLSARAEALARQAGGDWSAWLERQLAA